MTISGTFAELTCIVAKTETRYREARISGAPQKQVELEYQALLKALQNYALNTGLIENDKQPLENLAKLRRQVFLHLLHRRLLSVLGSLSSLEKQIILLRFGIGGHPQRRYAQQQIALRIGVSQSTVSRKLHKALRKLKHPSRSRRLKLFYEKMPKTDLVNEESLLIAVFGRPDA